MNSLFLNKKALLFLFAAAAINFCFPADADIFCNNGVFFRSPLIAQLKKSINFLFL